MCAQTTRLSDRQLKAVKPKDKDYVLTDGDQAVRYGAVPERRTEWNGSKVTQQRHDAKPESCKRPFNSDGSETIPGPGSSSMCAGFSLST